MAELNQFCQSYLPQYFVYKFTNCKLKPHFFDYKNEGNLFELTGRIFSLIDKLLSANAELKAAGIVDKYFIFKIMDFKKYRGEIAQNQECKSRLMVRQILKSMNQNDRMCFQIFVRMAYLYFDRRQKQVRKPQKKIKVEQSQQKKNKQIDYFDELLIFYYDVKILTMTEDDSFLPVAFMEYIIFIFLNLNPNEKFFKLIIDLMRKCQFSEAYFERINNKINELKIAQQFKKNYNNRNNNRSQRNLSRDSILQPKDQNPSKEKIQNGQQTPIKEKSPNKSQGKTHETSQKKQNIIRQNPEEQKIINSLKTTLNLHNKSSSSAIKIKERTIYARKKYLISKKSQNINDINSSTGSNQNYNQKLVLFDINRNYQARCFDVSFNEAQDFLVGATPKPKKKVKLQKTHTQPFDDNGQFVKNY